LFIFHFDETEKSKRYYDPELDSLEAKLTTNAGSSKRKLVRTNLYTFTHGAIRDWWSDYHYTLIKSSSSTCSSTHHSSPYHPLLQSSTVKYKPEWACLLLGSRLLRSSEFNERLHSLKAPTSVRLILEQLAYFVRAISLIGAGDEQVGLEVLAYLLTLYLPVLSSVTGILTFNFQRLFTNHGKNVIFY